MAKRRGVRKRRGKPGLRPTQRESRAGRRRGPIRGDLPHGEGGAGARAAEDTVFAAHPSAVIDPGATVGAGTRIWHWSHVMTGARIGRGCSLGQNVFVGTDVVIGDRVKIQNNVSVYEGVVLEDDVFCGPSMVFTNVINPRSHVPRKRRVPADDGAARRDHRRQRDRDLRPHHRAVRVRGGGRGRHARCAGPRARRGGARTRRRVDVSLRAASHVQGHARRVRRLWRAIRAERASRRAARVTPRQR